MLLAVVAACARETVEVPGETVVVEKIVTETVEVPGETVVVEKEVIKTVEVPGETVTKEVVKEVMVPGETVVVEKEVIKTVEVPGETVVVEKEVVKTVAGPERVVVKEVYRLLEEPQYGGTFTFPDWWLGGFDSWDESHGEGVQSYYIETLSILDWASDRDWNPMMLNFPPLGAATGLVAESWEEPDPETLIFHIRKGVHWHDKPPANGRELDAYDVEWSWHRLMGWPEKYGFTEQSPKASREPSYMRVKSVEATDKWTVVIKHEPGLHFLGDMVIYRKTYIWNRETVEKYGDLRDWRNAMGTGPFILEDVVEGSSVTWTKNPNYWGRYEYDPQYQLPFVDEVVQLQIEERGTALAGFRTGKIDILSPASPTEWQSLLTTNAQIQSKPYNREGHNIGMKLDDPEQPWYDIKVRKAMQMAINREEIAETIYHGLVPWKPYPLLGPNLKDFIVEWEEWPEDLQEEYSYNPEGAENLLDEAGYPRGADGIRFEAEMWMDPADQPAELAFAMVSNLDDIGIDIELIDMSALGFWDTLSGWREPGRGLKEMTFDWGSFSMDPMMLIIREQSADGEMAWSGYQREDVHMQALIDQIIDAADQEEYKSLVRELYLYYAKQHYRVFGLTRPQLVVWQPWLKGYQGERYVGNSGSPGPIRARIWIDQDLKK